MEQARLKLSRNRKVKENYRICRHCVVNYEENRVFAKFDLDHFTRLFLNSFKILPFYKLNFIIF